MNKIIELLKEQDNFAVFTHVSPDGDAIGSLFSLVYVLRKMGKKADAYVSGDIPKRLSFMSEDFGFEYSTELSDKKEYACCISVDCADESRLGQYKELYFSAPVTICIDHHVTNKGYGKYNLICGNASSNGEVLFDIFEDLNAFDEISASLVYAAIASDSGCFGFSNTSAKTHICAAKLMEYGANCEKYNHKLFFCNAKTTLRAKVYAMENTEYYFDDKVALAVVSDKILESIGATREDSDDLVRLLKDTEGVEVAVLLKAFDDRVKVSLRTTNLVDATEIACRFGGGGHARAAGCTIFDKSVDEAKTAVLKTLEEFF